MRIELTSAGLLHFQLGNGQAVDTIALGDLVYLEIDAGGHPLALDFVVAEDFLSFIKDQGGVLDIPDRVDPDTPDRTDARSQDAVPVATR